MRFIVAATVFMALFMVGPLTPEREGWTAVAAAKVKASAPPAFEYIEMAPMTLPIITEQGLTQQVSMIVALEVHPGHREAVERMGPRLADAYLRDLYGRLGMGRGLLPNNAIDVQAVKNRLTEVTYSIFGEEQVNAVLLQVLQQRRMM